MPETPNTGETHISSTETGFDLLGVLSLNCRWGGVLAAGPNLAERTKRNMLREVGCAAPFGILRALVCEGEHRIVGRVADPGPDGAPEDVARFGYAEQVRIFNQAWVDALPLGRKLRNLCYAAMESVAYGHKLAEVEWEDATLLPVDIAPKPRLNYRFEKDKSNRVTAVLANGSDEDKLPPANFILWTFGGQDYDPEGEGALVAAYPAWYDKGLTRIRQQKSVDQAGGGLMAVEQDYPPQGVTVTDTVKVKDTSGAEREELVSVVAAQQAKRLRSNDVAVFPRGMHPKFLSVDAHSLFDAVFDRDDREMTLAFLHVARATIEAQHGSKADSGTAEGFVETFRDSLRALVCDPINGLMDLVTLLHFGPDWLEFSPRYEIVTEEPESLIEIGKILQGELANFTLDQLNFYCDRAGVPRFEVHPKVLAEPEDEETDPDDEEEPNFALMAARKKPPTQANYKTFINRRRAAIFKDIDNFGAGKIQATELADLMAIRIREAHGNAQVLGRQKAGKLGAETSRDVLAADKAFKADQEFLSGFVEDLRNGRYGSGEEFDTAAVKRRADMYIQKARSTANAAFVTASPPRSTFMRVLGGNENHCTTCPPKAKEYRSAAEIRKAGMPGDGSDDCVTACTCRIVRGDGVESFARVD